MRYRIPATTCMQTHSHNTNKLRATEEEKTQHNSSDERIYVLAKKTCETCTRACTRNDDTMLIVYS